MDVEVNQNSLFPYSSSPVRRAADRDLDYDLLRAKEDEVRNVLMEDMRQMMNQQMTVVLRANENLQGQLQHAADELARLRASKQDVADLRRQVEGVSLARLLPVCCSRSTARKSTASG